MVSQAVEELLVELNQRGIKLWAEGIHLRSKSPKDQLTPVLRASIREHKEELLIFLSQFQTSHTRVPSVPRCQNLSLSFAEQRLWFIHQLEPDIPSYNIPLAYRLRGILNNRALEESITHLIKRHESLRTTFSNKHEELVRVIANQESFVLPLIDLSALTDDKKKAEVKSQIEEEANFSFNLQDGPLLRVSLLQLADQEHIFLINMHHIISDGWSIGILWRELATLYNALCNNQSPSLPDLTIQYADFAHWQRKRDDILSGQLAYWKKNLRDIPSILALRTDHARTNQQHYRGASVLSSISPGLTQALNSLSQRKSVTLFMLLLTVFKVLLFRYSAEEDVVVGTPIANRTMRQIESVVGFFINTLALRSNLSGNPTFTQLLAQVRHTTLDAYQNQDLPFDKLVEELSPERTLSHHPLFQVMFILQNASGQALTLSNLEVSQIPSEQQISKFDLTLTVNECQGALQIHFNYNNHLFEQSTIKRMAEHFQTLLEGIVANPEISISDIPLLTKAERRQLLVEWNDTATDYPHDKCIHQLFEEQAERTPSAIALIFGDEQLIYRQLNARANQLAHYLRTLGVEPDVLVGICVERSIEMVVGILAILKAGGAYLPIDPHLPQERISFMLEDAQVRVLLTEQKWLSDLSLSQLILVCLDLPTKAVSEKSQENLINLGSSSSLAYVIYTSGSTGTPKGAMITHQGLGNFIHWQKVSGFITQADRALQRTTLSFDVASNEILTPLLTGATVVIAPSDIHQDLNAFVHLLIAEKITYLCLPPSVLRLLAGEPKLIKQNYLRLVISGGEELDVNLRNKFLENINAVLLNAYGPTETTNTVLCHQCQLTDTNLTASIGRPITNTKIYLLDTFQQLVPIGHIGELCISGDCVGPGYLNNPKLTAEKFVNNPFGVGALYKTGDLARSLPDGSLEFLGRKDYQVKIRGFRIELGEIESALNSHSAVQEAVVVARENEYGDKQLVAYVVCNTTEELRADLASKLPNYMLPSFYVQLDSLPLTPNGKIDRHALPELDMSRLTPEKSFVAPRSIVESQLAAMWAELLNIERVGIHDNFFELGGHSLLAVTLFDKIQKLTGQELPLSTLFETPTIDQQAKILRKQNNVSHQNSLVAVQAKGSKPPLFLVPPAGGTGLGFRRLASLLGSDQPIYTFEPFGQDGVALPHTSVEEIAAYYVHELRELQSEGPYRLGGTCFGGHVAWEMAYQLKQAGIAVDALLILDPAPPANGPTWKWTPPPKKTPMYLMQRIYHHALHGTLPLMIRPRWLRAKALFDKRTERFMRLHQVQYQAQINYRAQPFLTTMLLVQSEQYSNKPEYRERWQMLAESDIEMVVIPESTHRSLLVENETHVQQLAEFIQNYLARLESGTYKSDHL